MHVCDNRYYMLDMENNTPKKMLGIENNCRVETLLHLFIMYLVFIK